jgi:predicted P-loop ATPase
MMKEKPVIFDHMRKVIESDSFPDYHPFRYYLDHLPPWDGEDHILAMSVSVTVRGSVEDQMRFAEYLRKWLVAMVAGWVDDTVVNNVILVLIGEQGSYKTTWFNYLLPPELKSYFYTKSNANRMGRDDLLTLAQYGLVCCEELDTMRPSELNQLKAAVTMPSIDERAAYAHFHEHRKHIASFCGTGNNAQFLSDPTGNRRWLPFEIESIESPRDHPFDYAGIYAQAYGLYRQGFQYWFSREEILRLAEHNRQFETPRLEYELANLYFCQPSGARPGVFMSVARAMQIVSANISQKLSPVYLGRAMGELGFRRVKYNGQRGYIVVPRTADEIQSAQLMMACEAEAVDSGQQGQ